MTNLTSQKEFFPNLEDKAIVDFINGLNVINDHNNIMKENSDLQWRLLDSISGKNHKRQTSMNASFADGLNACSIWLGSITNTVVEHAYAIERINGILTKQTTVISQLVDEVVTIKESIISINKQINHLNEKINSLNSKVKAKDQIDKLMIAWKADDKNFQDLSLIEKVYYFLENLAYGAFNSYLIQLKENYQLQDLEEEKKYLKNCLIDCIKNDLKVVTLDIELPISRQIWVKKNHINPEKQEVLAYLGDRSLKNSALLPMTYLASQWHYLSEDEKNKSNVNHIISVESLINNLQREIGLAGVIK